jgi:hypothetical protein
MLQQASIITFASQAFFDPFANIMGTDYVNTITSADGAQDMLPACRMPSGKRALPGKFVFIQVSRVAEPMMHRP